MRRAEVARGESKDLEGEAFGFNHHKTWQGKPDHGTPVVESTPCKAGPANETTDEADVGEQTKRKQDIGNSDGDGGTGEAPIEVLEKGGLGQL